jgi:hypothetical protein
VAEGAPLLRAYTLIAYRGFESLALRHNQTPHCGVFFWLRRKRGGGGRAKHDSREGEVGQSGMPEPGLFRARIDDEPRSKCVLTIYKTHLCVLPASRPAGAVHACSDKFGGLGHLRNL